MLKMEWTSKGLRITETDPFEPQVCTYRATVRRTRQWGDYQEEVQYAVIDSGGPSGAPNTALAAVARWIAENPGPPGWGGYRPAVVMNGRTYALDYNDWITLRGWT